MKAKIEKFLIILKIELKDLEADLKDLEDVYKCRKADEEISNYVFLENLATISDEIKGIEKLINSLNNVDPSKYSSVDEFIPDFIRLCRDNKTNADLPEAVYRMFERKLIKVKSYLFE
ncbi:MAG: hypothetical protein JEY99_00620 [Spirochaetales bacterium]|nr:hypothetical protein [Spirochaetales bacterium]